MSRLTKKYGKYDKPYCFNCKEEVRFDNDIVRQMLYKMGGLEDLEEELGCPLDVVAKAIIQNCIYMGFLTETEIGLVWEDNEPKYVISVEQWENGNQVELKDYKKTWWLIEDKSE